MTRSAHNSEHNRHDRLLVARYAAGDSYRGELANAKRLVDTCSDCARLADDVRLLSRAVGELPVPARPRDFRLSREQAATLRGSWFDRFLRRFGTMGVPALRPIAGVALSIGLVLAVVGNMGLPLQFASPAAAPGAGAGAPMDRMGTDQTPGGSPFAAPQEIKGSPTEGGGVAAAPEGPVDSVVPEDDIALAQSAEQEPVDLIRLALVYAGVTLAAISFGVLLLAWYARRREDPLLR